MVFSILFAEVFPFKWEKKGKSRILLSTTWILASMFMVFIYLCNLRSHLVRAFEETPPYSTEELALPKHYYKLHFFPPTTAEPFVQSLVKQGRFVPTPGNKFQLIYKLAIWGLQICSAIQSYFQANLSIKIIYFWARKVKINNWLPVKFPW